MTGMNKLPGSLFLICIRQVMEINPYITGLHNGWLQEIPLDNQGPCCLSYQSLNRCCGFTKGSSQFNSLRNCGPHHHVKFELHERNCSLWRIWLSKITSITSWHCHLQCVSRPSKARNIDSRIRPKIAPPQCLTSFWLLVYGNHYSSLLAI